MGGQKADGRDRILGPRIVQSRKRVKLTQRKVANLLGISPAQLQKYEKGTNRISAINLGILSQVTGVSFASFLDDLVSKSADDVVGFAEKPQESLVSDRPLAGLAVAITHHIRQNFDERDRHDIAEFAGILSRELKD